MMNRDPFRQAAQRLNRAAPQGERVAYVDPTEERLLKAFGGSGTPVNGIPSYQPTMDDYGTAMREALETQLAMVTGKKVGEADYGDVIPRGMEDIIAAERPGRMAAAQAETDVVRQTLLGGQKKVQRVEQPDGSFKYGIPGATPVTSEQVGGAPTQAAGGRYQMVLAPKDDRGGRDPSLSNIYPVYRILDTETGGLLPAENQHGTHAQGKNIPHPITGEVGYLDRGAYNLALATKQFNELNDKVTTAAKDQGVPESEVEVGFEWNDPNTGQPLKEGQVVREGTGMVDLFGPKGIAEYDPDTGERVTRGRTEYGAGRAEYQDWKDKLRAGEAQGMDREKILADYGVDVDTMSDDELAEFHYDTWGKTAPDPYAAPDFGGLSYKQAGFATQADVDAGRATGVGEFMGLTTLGEETAASGARRQHTLDISEVERLGKRATDAYRAQGDISGALAAARGLGPGGARGLSAIPTDPLFSGTATTSLQKTAEGLRPGAYEQLRTDMPTITGGRIGGEYDPTGGTDPLRKQLIAEAREGLGKRLTTRELENIEQGSRIASGARGRMRDKGSIQQEVEARLLEDRQRQAMNRAFAAQTLGQEAGYQTSDLGRGMQAQLANLQAGQQAGQFDISQEIGRRQSQVGRELGAAESDVERATRQQAMAEQYRQAGLGQERAAAGQMVGLEQATGADPFQAILGRPSGAGAAIGQKMFGSADYGLTAGPEYVAPQTGLSYISAQNAAEAGMYGAQQQAAASRSAGKKSMIGGILGGIAGMFCWVAREAYGADNPKWLRFREWMLHRASDDLREYYVEHGPAIAESIRHDEPAKARMRDTMDAILEGS